jgi:hypothetical protein
MQKIHLFLLWLENDPIGHSRTYLGHVRNRPKPQATCNHTFRSVVSDKAGRR